MRILLIFIPVPVIPAPMGVIQLSYCTKLLAGLPSLARVDPVILVAVVPLYAAP
jgi:hypothetical protein